MSFLELANRIPPTLQEKTVERLIDLILNSPNAAKLPSGLARSLLDHCRRDELVTQSGLSVLLQASVQLEPQRTVEIFRDLNLGDVAGLLQAGLRP